MDFAALSGGKSGGYCVGDFDKDVNIYGLHWGRSMLPSDAPTSVFDARAPDSGLVLEGRASYSIFEIAYVWHGPRLGHAIFGLEIVQQKLKNVYSWIVPQGLIGSKSQAPSCRILPDAEVGRGPGRLHVQSSKDQDSKAPSSSALWRIEPKLASASEGVGQ